MLNQVQIQANKEKFVNLVNEASQLNPSKANGLKKLLSYLETTDFFEAPASTTHHQSYKGGLCEHSVSVFDHLERLVKAYEIPETEISRYSMIIVALFHDLCKIGKYEITYKTLPRKDEKGLEIRDENGKLIWENREQYTYVNDYLSVGHGSASIILIQHFIILSNQEAEAIFNHMGPYDLGDYHTKKDVSVAFGHNKLAYFLFLSDMSDVYL